MASCAASRVKVSSVPVSTKVFPANSPPELFTASAGQVIPQASNRSTICALSGRAEIGRHIAGHHGSDVGHALNVIGRGAAQRRHIAEILGESQRRRLPHIADPERERNRGRLVRLAASSAFSSFCADFSPRRSRVSSCAARRSNKSAGVFDPVLLDQLIHELIAQSLNIQRAARSEMLDLFLALRRAGAPARAARHGLLALSDHR